MADWNVHVDNDEVSVYDTSSHATLEEIRDLLKLLLERLPVPVTITGPVPSFPAMDGSCFICGGKHGGLQCPRAAPCSADPTTGDPNDNRT